jgi:hypothetical protein
MAKMPATHPETFRRPSEAGRGQQSIHNKSLFAHKHQCGQKNQTNFRMQPRFASVYNRSQSNLLIHQCCRVEVQVTARLGTPSLLDR